MPAERRVTKLTVDLSGVADRREGGGRSAKVPEGDYLLKVKDAVFQPVKNGPNKGKQQVLWTFDIVKPEKHKNAGSVWHRTGIWPEQAWTFRNMIQDLKGLSSVAKKSYDVDLTKYIGLEVGATLVDGQPYGDQGRVKSEISNTFPAKNYEATETEEADEDDDTDADEEELETSDDDEEVEEVDEESI